ncbi:hypothetical protein [Streptomyces sp. NPDC101234]|uniref:hypothetical protein n=1 Tax=Streptomyces sp. NPDC101234 TaxID=3366138 RepID=UPI0037FA8BBF
MTSPRRRALMLAGTAATSAMMVLGWAATATAASSYTTAPVELNVRSGPGTSYSIVRVLSASSVVELFCQTPGTTVSGYYGTSNIWDNIGGSAYVSDTYVHTGSDGYVTARCS